MSCHVIKGSGNGITVLKTPAKSVDSGPPLRKLVRSYEYIESCD